jgi:hypothetical protein
MDAMFVVSQMQQILALIHRNQMLLEPKRDLPCVDGCWRPLREQVIGISTLSRGRYMWILIETACSLFLSSEKGNETSPSFLVKRESRKKKTENIYIETKKIGVREARTLDLRITRFSYETYALANCATTPSC